MIDLGIVVIGRNEGTRLRQCLSSIQNTTSSPVVYVDSGSEDESVAIARACGVEVLELDPGEPFSAARARNEGLAYLFVLNPLIQLVQFIDGDCTLLPGWLKAARDALLADSKCAAIIGHLQELNTQETIYNRLCALEWRSPLGEIKDFGGLGGISMMRIDVLRKLGGFNPDVIAGEDSELGVRMSLAGYRVMKIDQAMATHDANIHTFRQWWRRAVRAGHAIGQRSYLNGNTELRDCARERNSTWFWGIGVPMIVLVTLIPTNGLSIILLSGYSVLFYRVIKFRRGQGDSNRDAFLYARFLLLAKFANAIGLIKFYQNRLVHRYLIIEYK